MKPVNAGAIASAAADARNERSPPFAPARSEAKSTPASQNQHANSNLTARGAAIASEFAACCVDTERRPASKRLLNAMADMLPALSRTRKRTRHSRIRE
jgi:hypothetical protein